MVAAGMLILLLKLRKKLYESHLMMHNAWREELTANLKWEAHGVSLD